MLLSQFSDYDRIYSSSFSRKRDEEDSPAVEVKIGLGESDIGYRPSRSNTALKTGLGLGTLYLLSQGGGGKPPPFAGASKVPKIVKKTTDAVGIDPQVQKVTQVGVNPPSKEAIATLEAMKATPKPRATLYPPPPNSVFGERMVKANTDQSYLTFFRTKVSKSDDSQTPQSTILPRSKYAKRIDTKNFTNSLDISHGYQ